MVKIGVMSDSHVMTKGKVKLPKTIYSAFDGVDRIFHAGDIISPSIIEQLSKIAPVTAVRGNMDSDSTLMRLPEMVVENIEGVDVGIIHGWGSPKGIENRIKQKFPPGVRCIVFGHTHSPVNEEIDGIYFFNPGASIDKIYSLYNSVGLLYIDKGDIRGEIIEI